MRVYACVRAYQSHLLVLPLLGKLEAQTCVCVCACVCVYQSHLLVLPLLDKLEALQDDAWWEVRGGGC